MEFGATFRASVTHPLLNPKIGLRSLGFAGHGIGPAGPMLLKLKRLLAGAGEPMPVHFLSGPQAPASKNAI